MDKIITGFNPSFLLRGVVPSQALNDYKSGKCKNIHAPCGKVSTPITEGVMGKELNADPTREIYTFRNKSNHLQIVATTNCKAFTTFINTKTNEPVTGGRCKYCLREFKGPAMGLPVKLEQFGDKNIIYYTDTVCSYRCCFALWKRKYNNSFTRDFRYSEGEQIIKYLYQLQYPGKDLREAPDPDLLICNGGSLTDEEYDNYNSCYQPIPSLIWAPVKTQAFKMTPV